MQEETHCEFRSTRMMQRLRRFTLDGDNSQDLILPHVDLVCFDYPFPTAWFATRRNHFKESLDFENRFREKISPSPFFVPWHCVEVCLIPSWERTRFYVPVNCPEWQGF